MRCGSLVFIFAASACALAGTDVEAAFQKQNINSSLRKGQNGVKALQNGDQTGSMANAEPLSKELSPETAFEEGQSGLFTALSSIAYMLLDNIKSDNIKVVESEGFSLGSAPTRAVDEVDGDYDELADYLINLPPFHLPPSRLHPDMETKMEDAEKEYETLLEAAHNREEHLKKATSEALNKADHLYKWDKKDLLIKQLRLAMMDLLRVFNRLLRLRTNTWFLKKLGKPGVQLEEKVDELVKRLRIIKQETRTALVQIIAKKARVAKEKMAHEKKELLLDGAEKLLEEAVKESRILEGDLDRDLINIPRNLARNAKKYLKEYMDHHTASDNLRHAYSAIDGIEEILEIFELDIN